MSGVDSTRGRSQVAFSALSELPPRQGFNDKLRFPRGNASPARGRGTPMAVRVTVWGENVHEHRDESVRKIYPDGMHTTIARGIGAVLGDAAEIRTATVEAPEHGL